MPCELIQDDTKSFPGLTLYSKSGSRCMKPTGVYIPRPDSTNFSSLNVVLWLHGFYVKDSRYLFRSDKTNVRRQALDSGKNVVVIAPFLGHKWLNEAGEFEGVFDAGSLGGAKWGERYLNEVLEAIKAFRKGTSTEAVQIKNLVVACHSGGGVGMRAIVGTLGDHTMKLKACWGFDCLYGRKLNPDDATFWTEFLMGDKAQPLTIIFGGSTIWQSVKLYLIGQGKATRQGNRADPPGPKLQKLEVQIGHSKSYPNQPQTHTLAALDAIVNEMTRSGSDSANVKAKQPVKPSASEFATEAAKKLAGEYKFHDDVHYLIANTMLLNQLKSAPFL